MHMLGRNERRNSQVKCRVREAAREAGTQLRDACMANALTKTPSYSLAKPTIQHLFCCATIVLNIACIQSSIQCSHLASISPSTCSGLPISHLP